MRGEKQHQTKEESIFKNQSKFYKPTKNNNKTERTVYTLDDSSWTV